MQFTKVAELKDLPPGRLREVEVNGRLLALANVEGKVYAVDNRCPHQGGPLARGRMEGSDIICPWHGWRWDPASGKAVRPPVDWRVYRFPVRVEDGDILVGNV